MEHNNIRVINAPASEIAAMLCRRIPPDTRKILDGFRFNSIALLSANIPNIYYFADIAKKAGNVVVSDIYGSCPSHITALAIFGDVSAVRAAVNAIESADS